MYYLSSTMATVLSTWFDADHLQNILRCIEKDESIEISDFTIKPATNEGDNHGSDIYRITVEFSRVKSPDNIREKKSLILKIVPNDDYMRKIVLSTGIFDVELSILSETLPRMNEIIAKLSSTPLGVRCLHAHYEEPIHMILDDLAPMGFRMAERRLGLDLEHCLLAIRNLGRFHGASIALKEKDLTVLKKYERGMYHKDMPTSVYEIYNTRVASLAKELPHWPELNPGITDKIIKLSEVAYDKACETCIRTRDDFVVLNHGDFWINNMMFRYDDQQKPIDHIFMDFQICHWGSPAEDILHFFGGSTSYEVRFNHRDLILREYHSSLTNTMKELQCAAKAPSFDGLRELLQRGAFFEVLPTMTMLPDILIEKGNAIEFSENLKPNAGSENPGFRGKLFKKIMLRLLPLFDGMGLLDV